MGAANFAWLRWVSAWEDETGGEVWGEEDAKRAFMAGWEACAAEERRAIDMLNDVKGSIIEVVDVNARILANQQAGNTASPQQSVRKWLDGQL